MKSDINRLMEERDLDAILVTGPGQHNPPMVYLTGGAHLTRADVIQARGRMPVLFHASMERDEAAKSGLETRDLAAFNFHQIVKESNGDVLKAYVILYRRMLEQACVTRGRLAIYGQSDAGRSYALFSALQRELPDLEIVGENEESLLMKAMATKDESEVERIRGMGAITTQVVAETADFLSSHGSRDGLLVKPDGEPLTIGEVKRRINLWLAERGAENPEGTIFAQGRDAGIPHSTGQADAPLRLGETIVFDIFPCEAGGGYFYDFTRTWCLGYAPDETLKLYEDVRSVYEQIMSELTAGDPCHPYQVRTCELFEAQGHPTVQSNPQTQEGYVHSLGHGLGLQVHELPRFGVTASEEDRLAPGVVVTIEPGLYYPARGMGVRLENSVYVRPDGAFEVLAEYPLDLILPVKESV